MTINLPDDIHERVAVDALRKRRNSKEVVITEILRAYYGGGQPREKAQEALDWHLTSGEAKHIHTLRREAKSRWA
jgi:plasmid stability protein